MLNFGFKNQFNDKGESDVTSLAAFFPFVSSANQRPFDLIVVVYIFISLLAKTNHSISNVMAQRITKNLFDLVSECWSNVSSIDVFERQSH